MDPKSIIAALLLSVAALPVTSFAAVSAPQQRAPYASDVEICSKVKTALLSHRDLHVLDVKVSTLNGFVQLTGYVKSSNDLMMAERITQNVQGVVKVRNDLLLEGEIMT